METKRTGEEIYDLIRRLYPICRSITGNGTRETLKIVKEFVPIVISEVPSGTKVFDWTVPKEWNIKDAYIKNPRGEKIVDFKKLNLHILNYSAPFKGRIQFAKLKEHLFTLPEYPDLIPYLTSYYNENWGFCISHKQYEKLEDGEYEVMIDSELKDGSLVFGELFLKGETEEEILFSTYICHPSLCNDNLSGIAVLAFLAKELMKRRSLRYSYRFLFVPETIGSITWLYLNEKNINKIKGGLVLTCLGDAGRFTYKKTRQGDSIIDEIAEKTLLDSGDSFEIIDFFPAGSDERQFSSPAFNLAIGSLMRTPYGKFHQYHTSADDLGFVKPECLEDSYKKYLDIIFILENNRTYLNPNPKCEPQLSRRGIYRVIGSQKQETPSMLSILNLSDGKNSLLDIAKRTRVNFKDIKKNSDILFEAGLLKEV